MADRPETETDPSAEKAYAAAAEAVSVKPEPAETPAAVPAPAEVEFPSKAKRTAAPRPAAAKPSAKTASKPAKAKSAAAKKAVKTKPKAGAAKAKPAAKPVSKNKPYPAKPAPIKKPAPVKTIGTGKTVFQQLKDKTMDTSEFTTKMKSAVADVQIKAKEAFDKGAAAFSDYNEFSKGNFEAVVESGKILATGVQSLGSTLVADTKTNFETLTAEVKELASVKSPADFFKLQAAFVRRNFDLAVAQTSKNSEAVLKLANEVAAPISGRVSVAVEKIKQAA
jgi:phasin family protein